MKIQHFLLSFGLVSILLTACTPATATPDSESQPLPENNENNLVLSWHREGGIAGFCDDVKVFADGSYTVESCRNDPRRTGQLDSAQQAQLLNWVNTFSSFQDGTDPATPAYPDQMFVKIIFSGTGSTAATSDDIAAMSSFAGTLAAPRPDMSIDPVQPKAAFKARDFLAAQLNIPSEQIKIVSAEAVDWPDRCLGVVTMGILCAQGVTPGYLVILDVQGQQYELHTDQSGESIRMKDNAK